MEKKQMEKEKEERHSFRRKIVSVGNQPRIYILSSSEEEEPSGKQPALPDHRKDVKERPVSFFGHHIGKLLTPEKAETEEFLPIDQELESSLEIVRKKLRRTEPAQAAEGGIALKEELKHKRFIEERNSAQESLFDDIVRRHQEFISGLNAEDLWSLHDLMEKAANHETACSLGSELHEHVECNVLSLLRRKVAEQAWQKVQDSIEKLGIPFPIPSSMLDPKDPVRNEMIEEETKKLSREEFLDMPARQLVDLILGNVPVWVYSYPSKDTYLWSLTVLRGVAAGLAANSFIKYLTIWEKNSPQILKKIQQEFVDKIKAVRQRGEAAIDLSEAFSVSMELQRISREEIPDQIWKYISSEVKGQ
jgi:hypothetical protein